MPNMTAQQLVYDVRQESGYIDPSKLIDGWADEVSNFPLAISILSAINRTYKDLFDTGFNKIRFEFPLISGTAEYFLTQEIQEIESAWIVYQDRVRRLEKTSIGDLDGLYSGAGWRNSQGMIPWQYYAIGTKSVGFFPKPLAEDITVVYLGTAMLPDMVNRTDVPGQLYDSGGNVITLDGSLPNTSYSNVFSVLPDRFQPTIVTGATARVLRTLGDLERAGSFFSDYGKQKKDLKSLVNTRLESDIDAFVVRNDYRVGARSGMRHNTWR